MTTKKKLRAEEFVPLAPEDPGTSKHEHQDCEDGPDHKKRLYVTREMDGEIVAFCHNCQRGGRAKEKGYVRDLKTLLDKSKPEAGDKEVKLPEDINYYPEEWPIPVRAWLYKYGLEDTQIKRYSLGFSKKYGRLIIPVFDEFGNVVRWQGRSWTSQPKHITLQIPDNHHMFQASFITTDTVVIVEDFVSAMRVGDYMSCVALSGVHMSDEQKLFIADRFNKAIIFLDDDNTTVKKKQSELRNDLDMLMSGNVMVYHSGGKDPKEHGFDELREVLLRCTKNVVDSETAQNVLYAEDETTS